LLSGYVIAKDPINSSIYSYLKNYGKIGTMPKNLSALSESEAKDIYNWIAEATAIGSDFTGNNLKILNRHYVTQIFHYVFGTSFNENYKVTYPTTAEKYILRNPVAFQGSCDYYSVRQSSSKHFQDSANPPTDPKDDTCNFGVSTQVLGATSSVRHGYLTQVCEKYTNNTASLNFALTKFHGWTTGDLQVTTDEVQKAYEAFYPERKAPDEVLAALVDVSSTTNINKDKWKWIYLTICLSAEWQSP